MVHKVFLVTAGVVYVVVTRVSALAVMWWSEGSSELVVLPGWVLVLLLLSHLYPSCYLYCVSYINLVCGGKVFEWVRVTWGVLFYYWVSRIELGVL